jgi:outer membrane murein-binding lipoprotein Lpp
MTAPVGGNARDYAEVDYYRVIDQAAPDFGVGLDGTHRAFQSVTSLPYYVTDSTAYALLYTGAAASFASVSITGTGGNGYYGAVAQSAAPSAPAATGWNTYADASGNFAWRQKNGSDTYSRIFSGTLSADRTYALPDYSMTFASLAGAETLTNKTLTTPVIAGASITGDVSNTATGYFAVASGTTGQRPGSPANGMIRYNSSTARMEFYAASGWRNFTRLDGDTMTGALEIDVATTTSEALILKTTDDNTTKLLLKALSSVGATVASIGATGAAAFATLDVASSTFTVASTGATAITTSASGAVLAVQGSASAASTILSLYNNAAFGTSNASQIDFRLNSSTSNRVAYRVTGLFSDTTDATRTSTVSWLITDAGSFTNVLQFVGKASTFFGTVNDTVADTATATVLNTLTVGHNSSGTPAANFGTGVILQGKSSTTVDTSLGRLYHYWNTATHLSRKAYSSWTVFDTAERIAITIGTDGSNPLVGLYNVTPVARPSALTQTYATATRTHANPTATTVSTTASTQTTPWGFASQAQADNIATQINNLIADVANVKQFVNTLADDLQAIGIEQ